MSNFFSFEEDINIVGYPFDPSRPFQFKAYSGTPFFSLNGYSYPETQFLVEKAVVLPKGKYQINLDKDLKGKEDRVVLKNSSKNFSFELSSEPKDLEIENQIELDLILVFNGVTNYLFGDNYDEQEDYGKDYSIQIKLISGGLYDREKPIAVLKGDIYEDGKITIEDLLFLRVLFVGGAIGGTEDIFRLDVNGDEIVNGQDLNLLQKYLWGIEFFSDIEFREEIQH